MAGIVTVYYSSEPPRDLVEKLRKAGFRVELRKAGDVDDVLVVGPFGVARGLKEARIVANQMLAVRGC